jgi:hypothetical protein
MTHNTAVHNSTQELILNNMFDSSMLVMKPSFDMIKKGNNEEYQKMFDDFLEVAKQEWLLMMREYLSTEEIDYLVQSFFYSSKIDVQKLLLFNTVFTQKVSELAETHLK